MQLTCQIDEEKMERLHACDRSNPESKQIVVCFEIFNSITVFLVLNIYTYTPFDYL